MRTLAAGFLLATSAALLASVQTAAACTGPACPVPVPEITALEGTAAIAAVVALVLLVWERRRVQA